MAASSSSAAAQAVTPKAFIGIGGIYQHRTFDKIYLLRIHASGATLKVLDLSQIVLFKNKTSYCSRP